MVGGGAYYYYYSSSSYYFYHYQYASTTTTTTTTTTTSTLSPYLGCRISDGVSPSAARQTDSFLSHIHTQPPSVAA